MSPRSIVCPLWFSVISKGYSFFSNSYPSGGLTSTNLYFPGDFISLEITPSVSLTKLGIITSNFSPSSLSMIWYSANSAPCNGLLSWSTFLASNLYPFLTSGEVTSLLFIFAVFITDSPAPTFSKLTFILISVASSSVVIGMSWLLTTFSVFVVSSKVIPIIPWSSISYASIYSSLSSSLSSIFKYPIGNIALFHTLIV